MDRITVARPDFVRAVIAREWLGASDVPARLRAVKLRPHQIDAARRLTTIIRAHGGALVCDEVGLGKTYVALAVARTHKKSVVVAPASLRSMWLAAADKCGVSMEFASIESLSRSSPKETEADFLIVDEAHHFRTPSARRFRSLATLCARRPILLVSATPLHNRESDVTALLSMFIGSAARALGPAHAARYIVRRNQAGISEAFPVVCPPKRISIRGSGDDLKQLLALPPPIPPSDGGLADAMVTHTLVRLWASSDAALREGLRRRLSKTVAMRHSLEVGRYPTRRELEAWSYSEGAVQLGFAELLASSAALECSALLQAVIAHERALVDLLRSMNPLSRPDAARVRRLNAIRERHPSTPIVAFSQFAETVAMYYRGLCAGGRVAMLTSRGARIASGPITRREALERFAPLATGVSPPASSESISLLLATDLLSEGVNLQDAGVVVHLDLPWTAAALEQRVGRVARLGSSHRKVFVYAIDPPAPSRVLVRAESIIRRKAALANKSIGVSRIPPLFARVDAARDSEVEESEGIRRALAGWIRDDPRYAGTYPACAAVSADRDGVLALVSVRGKLALIAGKGAALSGEVRVVRATVDRASGDPAPSVPDDFVNPVESAKRWMESELAADDAGSPAAGCSRLARAITARLARVLAVCPRHERARCSARIAAMHDRLQSPFTLGVELEIEELLRSDSSDFLPELETIVGAREEQRANGGTGIRAVLVLCGHAAPSE